MAVSFDKELYFTKDLTQYVSYKKTELNVEVPVDVRICIAGIYGLEGVPEELKKACINFLTLVNTLGENFYRNMESVIDKNNIKESFKNYDIENLNGENFSSISLLDAIEKTYANTPDNLLHHISFRGIDYRARESLSRQTRFQILKDKNWQFELLFSERQISGSKIKYPILVDTKDLTDTSDKIVYEAFANAPKFKKAVDSLDKIIAYLKSIDKNDKKLIDKILFKNYIVTPHYSLRESKYQNSHFSISWEAFLEQALKVREETANLYELLKKKDIDFTQFLKKKWTGSLDEEEEFHFGKAFYIIGSGKGGQGFVGLKGIYNRGHSNSYTMTIVRDLKNAMLFTEGATYNLGYEIKEEDRLYVDMEFQHLSSQKSQLAQKLASYIDKNKIKAVLPEVDTKIEETPVKPKSNKL